MTVAGLLRGLAAHLLPPSARLPACLAACLAWGSAARADTIGFALVIGVDHYLGHPATTACTATASALRDALRSRHYTVETLLDPDGIALRNAIDDFATQLGGAPSGTTLIYFCGAAVTDGLRLFLFPAATDPQTAEPQTVGIVLQAPLKALQGTGGTVYADLDVYGGNAVAPAFTALSYHIPPGVHLAAAAGNAAALGQALVGLSIDPSSPWPTLVSSLRSEPDLAPGASIAYLPSPAKAASPPATPLPDTGVAAHAPPDGDGATRPASEEHAEREVSRPAHAARPRAETVRRHTARAALNPRIVRLQGALARIGCYAGLPTGQIDGATTAAIVTFQRRMGDPPTGALTPAEIVRLLNP